MAFVIKSDRFPNSIEKQNAFLGPGTYIGPMKYAIENTKAAFGSLTARGLENSEPIYNQNEQENVQVLPNSSTAYQSMFDASTKIDSVLDVNQSSCIFKSKCDRFGDTYRNMSDIKVMKKPRGSNQYIKSSMYGDIVQKMQISQQHHAKKNPQKGLSYTVKNKLKHSAINSRRLQCEIDLSEGYLKTNLFYEPAGESETLTFRPIRDYSQIDTRLVTEDKSLYATSQSIYDNRTEQNFVEYEESEYVPNQKTKGVTWYKPDEPERTPAYFPKKITQIGPTSYNNKKKESLLSRMEKSSVFTSNTERIRKLPKKNIVDCNLATQIKFMSNPGPGAYDLSSDISTGRTQKFDSLNSSRTFKTSRENLNRTLYGANTFNAKSAVLGLYKNTTPKRNLYEEQEYCHKWQDTLSDIKKSDQGPGSYNVENDMVLKSFKKRNNIKSFGVTSERFSQYKIKDFSKTNTFFKFDEEMFTGTHRFKKQSDVVKQIKYGNQNVVPFNFTEDRILKNPNLKEMMPGPGNYHIDKIVEKEYGSYPAFRDTIVKAPNEGEDIQKGSIPDFMSKLVEKERSKKMFKINKKHSFKKTVPSNRFYNREAIPESERGTQLSQIILTTVPTDKLLGDQIFAGGDMHSLHLHKINDPKERIVYRRDAPKKPFLSDKPRFDSDSTNVPGPGNYDLKGEDTWEKRTFNVNYLNKED